MTETVEAPVQQEQQQQPTDFYTDMLRSFNAPKQEVEQVQEVPQGTQEQQVQQEIVEEQPIPTEQKASEIGFDEFRWLSEKTGGKFKSWDEIAPILENPAEEKKELEFANDYSKKIYEAFVAGKEEEIFDFLNKKQRAKVVAEKSTEEVAKLYIKDKYPTFNEVEVEYFYNKEFGIDEDAFEDDEIGLSVAKKQVQSRLENFKQEALNFYNSQVQEIQLPVVEQKTAAPVQDDRLNSENAKLVATFVEAQLKASKYAELQNEIPFEYSNAQNGIAVKGKVPFDEASISELENKIGEYPDVVIATRYFKDGQFDSKKFARDNWILDNLDKLVQGVAAQSANEGYVSKLKVDKNYTPATAKTGSMPDISDVAQKVQWYKFNGFAEDKIAKALNLTIEQVQAAL